MKPEDHTVAKDQLQDSDTCYVKGLFEEALQVNVQPFMCRRLGKPSQEKGGVTKRPLLVETESLVEKTRFSLTYISCGMLKSSIRT